MTVGLVQRDAEIAVSVIVPARNNGRTLLRTLASIRAQRCTSWEVIVVDDGSTDDTADVARASGLARLRVVVGPGRGPGAARNEGARHARGEFVIFLDADDEAESEWLALLLAAAHPIAQGAAKPVDPTHIVDDTGVVEVVSCGLVASIEDDGRVIREEVHLPAPLDGHEGLSLQAFAGTLLMRAELFARIGGYDEDVRYSENTELAWRILQDLGARAASKMRHIDVPLLRYHVVQTRVATAGYRRKQLDALRRFSQKHGTYFDEHRSTGATYAALHGVLAARARSWPEARAAFALATSRAPWRVRNWLRRALAHVPALAARVWSPLNDSARGDGS